MSLDVQSYGGVSRTVDEWFLDQDYDNLAEAAKDWRYRQVLSSLADIPRVERFDGAIVGPWAIMVPVWS